DKTMYRLEEKDLSTKLDILFKKNMYSLAVNLVTSSQTSRSIGGESGERGSYTSLLAGGTLTNNVLSSSSEYDYGTLVEIYKRYGDWLYSKGDYDSAMNQYLHTIGQLEPSYVIRKFLDAQRIHNLTNYLQALHEKGLANADHTTLLLNCYTKLKDVKRLDQFIRADTEGSAGGKEVRFDVETAMRVCRAGGYYSHALDLAMRFDQHDWYLKIQVEDLKNYADTVEYISKLPTREQTRELTKYGFVLVQELPAEITDVLVRLCVETKAASVISAPGFSAQSATGLESAMPKGGNGLIGQTESGEPALGSDSNLSINRDDGSSSSLSDTGRHDLSKPLPRSFPEDFIHLYVKQPGWCVRFLEQVLEKRWGIVMSSRDKGKRPAGERVSATMTGTEMNPALDDEEREREEHSCRVCCNTLLELYLGGSNRAADGEESRGEGAEGSGILTTMGLGLATDLANDDWITADTTEARFKRESRALELLKHPKVRPLLHFYSTFFGSP
ncbi:Vacuolar protein sorting-associated protein 11, partial [Quaeritorhiza haematococci]